MKSTHKVERFDYSKVEAQQDAILLYQYWGLHPKSGRIHIDTKRYKRTCEKIGIMDFMPEGMFANRQTPYFVPSKVRRYDYAINIFVDLINGLRRDWNEEYKPVLSKIKTPKEVAESIRLNEMMYTSDPDDLDEINIDAMFGGIRRERQYNKIINSLYCQFISKICTEIDRYTLIVMCELGYKGKDYSFSSFAKFSDGMQNNKNGIKLSSLSKYNAYNLLHKINNFLKHNTISSYNDLRKFYPKNVCHVDDGTAKEAYQNGMFAGDWIILKENYIDGIFDSLIKFFEDYCRQFVGEDIERASWDYDEYFIDAFNQMKYPREYWGV